MDTVTAGDIIYSARHKGKLLVVIAGRRALVCRRHKKDGTPSLQEVVVSRSDIRMHKLKLPLK